MAGGGAWGGERGGAGTERGEVAAPGQDLVTLGGRRGGAEPGGPGGGERRRWGRSWGGRPEREFGVVAGVGGGA